eukprot:5225609-Prymnesium_polylepis.1
MGVNVCALCLACEWCGSASRTERVLLWGGRASWIKGADPWTPPPSCAICKLGLRTSYDYRTGVGRKRSPG